MEVSFKIPQIANSIIMVAGVGGGGGNAVRHMYSLGVTDVAFMVINTDKQALERSPIPMKIQLGDGLGAGNNPEKARTAALDSEDAIREALTVNNTKMLFVTAGMGGGTGTGASPVVARIAKEMGILTVGIVSIPYKGEGPKRVAQAVTGIEELIPCVDSLIVINNEHIAQIYGKLGIKEAHSKADDILAMAAKSIADIVTSHMDVNVDFADVTTIMKEDTANATMGKIALMGSATGEAEGEDRALKIAQEAVNSPLLHHNDIRGAKKVLLNITWGDNEVSYDEALQVMDFIQQRSGLTNDVNSNQTDVIWGAGEDPSLGNKIRITVIATGFDTRHIPAIREYFSPVIAPGSTTKPAAQDGGKVVVSMEDVDNVQHKREVEQGNEEFGVVTHSNSVETTYGSPQQVESQGVKPSRIEVSFLNRDTNESVPNVVANDNVVLNQQSLTNASISEDSMSSMIVNSDNHYDEPAYLRRKVSIYSEQRESGATRESLDSTPTQKSSSQSTISLFDE